ncbi:MAG: hypothetical protein EA350_15855 [Gemmatimonadales bacterium]|nr:MAG: hypothetical protein EA350_15855 [Gemmatimonadales bacterium]
MIRLSVLMRGLVPVLAGGLLFPWGTLEAQGGGPGRTATVGSAAEASGSEIEDMARRFAAALGQGNAEQLTRFLSDGGIRLRLQGLDRSALSVRQANAALREFLRGYEAGEARLVRAAPVAGSPGRAFAELRWQTRVAGTSHPAVHSVFLGLVEEGGAWRVDELRLLP